MTAPRVHHTGLGYEYVRCRCHGDDSTVYVHQLVAILAGESPDDVFSEGYDVHHANHIPWDNRPENVVLEESEQHRIGHLEGRCPA